MNHVLQSNMAGMNMNQGFPQSNRPMLIAIGIALFGVFVWWLYRRLH